MKDFFLRLFNRDEYEKLGGMRRSGQWPRVRDLFLRGKVCAVCGGIDYLVAHHVEPFHLNPARELDPTNLIAVCERPKVLNCHLVFSHFGSWMKHNSNIAEDAREWRQKLAK